MPNLNDFIWGCPNPQDEQQLARYIQQLDKIRPHLTTKNNTKDSKNVALAILVLITCNVSGVRDSLHGNALMAIKSQPQLLGLAIHTIYFELLASQDTIQKEKFIKELAFIRFSFRDDNFFTLALNDFYNKKELFNEIQTNLKSHLSVFEAFDLKLGVLQIKFNDETFLFNIEFNDIKTNPSNHPTINIQLNNLDNIDKVGKFIAVRVYAFLLSNQHNEIYNNLLTMTFPDYLKNDKYKHACHLIPVYLKTKKMISLSDAKFDEMSSIDKNMRKFFSEHAILKDKCLHFANFTKAIVGSQPEALYNSAATLAQAIHASVPTTADKEVQTTDAEVQITPISEIHVDIKNNLVNHLPIFDLFTFNDINKLLLIKINDNLVIISYDNIIALQAEDGEQKNPKEMKQYIAFRILRYLVNALYSENTKKFETSFQDFLNPYVQYETQSYQSIYLKMSRYFELKQFVIKNKAKIAHDKLATDHPASLMIGNMQNMLATFEYYCSTPQNHVYLEHSVQILPTLLGIQTQPNHNLHQILANAYNHNDNMNDHSNSIKTDFFYQEEQEMNQLIAEVTWSHFNV